MNKMGKVWVWEQKDMALTLTLTLVINKDANLGHPCVGDIDGRRAQPTVHYGVGVKGDERTEDAGEVVDLGSGRELQHGGRRRGRGGRGHVAEANGVVELTYVYIGVFYEKHLVVFVDSAQLGYAVVRAGERYQDLSLLIVVNGKSINIRLG